MVFYLLTGLFIAIFTHPYIKRFIYLNSIQTPTIVDIAVIIVLSTILWPIVLLFIFVTNK